MATSQAIRFNYPHAGALKPTDLVLVVVMAAIASTLPAVAWVVVGYYVVALYGFRLFGRQYVELDETGVRFRAGYSRYEIPYADVTRVGKSDPADDTGVLKLLTSLAIYKNSSAATCLSFRSKRLFLFFLMLPPLPVPFFVHSLAVPLSEADSIAFADELGRRTSLS